MGRVKLRTKFLISMLVISAGLTCTTLLLVHHRVRAQVRKEIFADLHNSITTFQNFQRDRELTLAHSAELVADLPILRALMTTQHEPVGLAVAEKIIHDHGGEICVEQTSEAGTVFRLTFPLALHSEGTSSSGEQKPGARKAEGAKPASII